MKCKLQNREQWIEDYVAGNLSAEAREHFDEHCFNCDACFNELRLREELIGLIRSEGQVLFADYLAQQKTEKIGILQSFKIKLDQFLWGRNRRWIYATVAVGAVVILSFFIFKNLAIRQKPTLAEKYPIDSTAIVQGQIDTLPVIPPDIVDQESAPKPPSTPSQKAKPDLDLSQAYAANFEPLAYYEGLIADVTRSAAVEVRSPKINEKVRGELVFQWEIGTDDAVQLKILNNRGKEIFNFTPAQNQFRFAEKLMPGLYYWKLETADELLYVGKFLVEGRE